MKERFIRFRSFWMFPLFSMVLLLLTFRAGAQSRAGNLLWLLPAGLLGWTLLEYVFHRFLLHGSVRHRAFRAFVSGSHRSHHAAPRDPDQILVHPSLAAAISAVLYLALWTIARDPFAAAGIISGVWTGFLYYEAVHYRVHTSLRNSALLQRQRRAHFHHHFSNSASCFGVTSPLWDYVFRTTRQPPDHSEGVSL